jgi:hypothetical protein
MALSDLEGEVRQTLNLMRWMFAMTLIGNATDKVAPVVATFIAALQATADGMCYIYFTWAKIRRFRDHGAPVAIRDSSHSVPAPSRIVTVKQGDRLTRDLRFESRLRLWSPTL